jgi:diguanylate cyclase (GGDEF)-like protein
LTDLKAPAIPESLQSPVILVVDDDELVREVVVESIRDAKFTVESCRDARHALERVKKKAYDLIVTDMQMPGMDGMTLIRRLRSANSDSDVIVITGYGSIENAVECMKAGALDYLIKPFTVDQIQVAVQKAIEHRELRRRALEREFYRRLSYVDALTGVFNRRHFNEALEAEVQKAMYHKTPLVLLMIDIDDFKIYNDCNGHPKGDQALTILGRLLNSCCRSSDVVTRYGGEEFAVIFPGATKEHAAELSDRISSTVRNSCFDGECCLPLGSLTVSIGAACLPDDADNSEDLLRCADEALYRAKHTGKDRVAFCKPPPR